MKYSIKAASLVAIAASLTIASTQALATHSWNGYHWARSANPFALNISDNVSSAWDSVLAGAISDWNQSDMLSLTEVPGNGRSKPCKAADGEVNVCSDSYGYTGWLGIAQIWLDGDHITKAVTKLNDSYFASLTYDHSYWRALVACQEIGHTFGLAHQDENFDNPNLGTCMDYTSNPLGPPDNEHPNTHDYDELVNIYVSHLDSGTSSTGGGGGPPPGKGRNKSVVGNDYIGNSRSGWGREIGYTADGRPDIYELQLGDGHRVITHVFWVPDAGRSGSR